MGVDGLALAVRLLARLVCLPADRPSRLRITPLSFSLEECLDPSRQRHWRFYVSSSGAKVFKDELKALGPEASAAVADTMKAVAKGTMLPREDEKVDDELRVVHATYDGCEYRVLYGVLGAASRVLLAVHAFNKKSPKLPAQAVRTARNRLRDWEDRGHRSKQT